MSALLAEIGATALLLGACVRAARDIDWREAVRQCFVLGNRSLFFIVVVMSFTGGILVIQASLQARRLIGDLTLIGPTFLQLLVREFGPTIVGMMVAARSGAGVAAELAAMRTSEQVDAMRMSGAEPELALVAPRLAAGLVAALPLGIFGIVAAYVAGGVAANIAFGLSWQSYASARFVGGVDVAVAVMKCLVFGAAIPLVASRAGLAAHGGAAGVGRATTRAVIACSLAVLALDVLLGGLGFGIDELCA